MRLVAPLTGPDGAGLALPASIVGIQLDVTPGGNLEVAESGTVDVSRSRRARTTTGPWTPLPVEGGRTVIAQGGGLQEVDAPAPLPEQVEIPALFGTEQRHLPPAAHRRRRPAAAILVNDAFLDRTGAAVGDTLQSSVFGAPLEVEILDTIDGFPTLDPGKPFALVDVQALACSGSRRRSPPGRPPSGGSRPSRDRARRWRPGLRRRRSRRPASWTARPSRAASWRTRSGWA